MATDATAYLEPAESAGTTGDGAADARAPSSLSLLLLALGFQAACTFFFVGSLWSEVLGLRSTPIPYEWQELIEVCASVGLVVGVVVTGIFFRRAQQREKLLRRQIDVAQGNFGDHLGNLFLEWALSPSEQAVTIYTMKGFSNAEIAEFRGTSASTVKTQLNSVYRKSGFANRQQLISFLVEDLFAGVALPCTADETTGPSCSRGPRLETAR